MKVKPIIAENFYDDDDMDTFDYDDFLKELEQKNPTKTLNGLMAENSITYEEALNGLNESVRWFDQMLVKYSAPDKHKLTVCASFCTYLENNIPDEDDYLFWQLCLSCKSDIFFDSCEVVDEEERVNEHLLFLEDINRSYFLYVNHRKGRKEFHKLISNITTSSEPIGKISLSKVKKIVRKLKFSGDYLDDNLEKLTVQINHSKELSQIAPVVFYSAFTRYKKRMVSDPDLDINFKKAFNRIFFEIKEDNHKNVKNFYAHLNIFLSFADEFCDSTENTYLNVEGFNSMSNICECELMDWSDYEFFRPFEQEIMSDYFSCFINGLKENPCYDENKVSFDDVISFEDFDNKRAAPARMLPKINDYIDNHNDICTYVRKMITESNTEKCTTAANEVLEGSGVNTVNFSGEMFGLMHTVIIREIMLHIDQSVKLKLLGLSDKFEEVAFAEYTDNGRNEEEGEENDKQN